MNILVIGYGSIGQRHTRVLNDLGHKVSVVSRRKIDYPRCFNSISDAIVKEKPEYIVVANETNAHEATLLELKRLDYDNKILVEKPLFSQGTMEKFSFSNLYVGYNLRFHPIIKKLFNELKGKSILSVQTYVGQYLPTWRPGTDYTESYSANISKGGGVLRDLSHELDYLHLLLGEWNTLVAHGGKYSELDINTDDVFSLMYQTEKCPVVNLQMNYLDFIIQRNIIINTNETTYKADLINNTLQVNEKIISFDVQRDDTYINQHLAVIASEEELLCTFDDGVRIVQMIDVAEESSREGIWKTNG